MRRPGRLPADSPVVKLKGPLLQFANADDRERSDILLDLLRKEVRSRLDRGVARLEVLLEAVGLDGGIDDIHRRVILELSEVRNVVVHHGGRADKRLVERCPWLGLNEEDPILADGRAFGLYVSASFWYLLDVDRRLRTAEGLTTGEEDADYMRRLAETQHVLIDRLTESWKARATGAATSPA